MSKHRKIVDAARKRFRYYGVSKTTMQEIAQDAGVAVGTLYLYFGNKDDLIVACAEEYARRHRENAEVILAARIPAAEKLRRYVVDRFRQSEETRTSSRHAAEITRAVLRVKPDRVEEEGRMMFEAIVKIFTIGVAERQFRIARPEEDARVFLLSLVGFFPNALSEPLTMPTENDLLDVVNWYIGVWKSGATACARRPAVKTRSTPRSRNGSAK